MLPPVPRPPANADDGAAAGGRASYLLSCLEILSSCASRFSSGGWVENSVDRLVWPLLAESAGAK